MFVTEIVRKDLNDQLTPTVKDDGGPTIDLLRPCDDEVPSGTSLEIGACPQIVAVVLRGSGKYSNRSLDVICCLPAIITQLYTPEPASR